MRIEHGRIGLALHRLAEGAGPTLLLLHELGGSSRDWNAAEIPWRGSVFALDFCGHGDSDWLRGGAYVPELLLADADAALAQLGAATVAGRGLGAYLALLLAGARADDVAAALLLGGRGLGGGAPEPTFAPGVFTPYLEPAGETPNGVDPRVAVLEVDVRPPAYAARFAHSARAVLLCEDGAPGPPWWEAARNAGAAAVCASENEAFRALERAARKPR